MAILVLLAAPGYARSAETGGGALVPPYLRFLSQARYVAKKEW
jgi:hypothetical protein